VSATISPVQVEAMDDLHAARELVRLGRRGAVTYGVRAGRENVWVTASTDDNEPLVALRCGFGGAIEGEPDCSFHDDVRTFTWGTKLGSARLKIAFPRGSKTAIRCTLSFLPVRDLHVSATARDLFGFQPDAATIHTEQRGLRSGTLFATFRPPLDLALLYFQDFSSLGEFFDRTRTSPADSVGGTLAQGGYCMPSGDNAVLPKAQEIVISDAFLAIDAGAGEPDEMPGTYLDLLADIYAGLERHPTQYRDWPLRAERTRRDLTLSPKCLLTRDESCFVKPYVDDDTKPPESMVQLVVLVGLLEYDAWRGKRSRLVNALERSIERFYDPELECVVRWLPGAAFENGQSEEHMNHEDMDSWYLYHALFNLSRLAKLGHASAREMFERSLPFAIRVARRFNYRWPVFFHLKTLDIVRAESSPGQGGENDVAGLYALVMLHAHELFGDPLFLTEARHAADALRDLGFALSYQMNTAGFAAEAMLRLWILTRDRAYLHLSELCVANLFDNMWLWRCEYGHAKHYRTFFGLFPLHSAPYMAAYEELELLAKFHEYLRLGGADIRPAVRFLIAEFAKYGLDRCAFYYPDALPVDVVAKKTRNGSIERALSIPLEDLQDGWSDSGSVGQEAYGSPLAFIYTTRHYRSVPAANMLVFCNYPMLEFTCGPQKTAMRFTTGGDARGTCELRCIPLDVDAGVAGAKVRVRGSSRFLAGTPSVEGHEVFSLRGDTEYEVRITAPRGGAKQRTKRRKAAQNK